MAEHLPEHSARRGRRDPELTAALEAEDDTYPEPGGTSILREGDMMMCRMTLAHPTAMGDGWFSWGITTTVGPGEAEEEAADRVYTAVTSRVYELIDGVTTTVEEAEAAQRAQRRTRRIRTEN